MWGPGNFNRSAISMFFLDVDKSMRWGRAPGFIILDLDGGMVGAERFEDDLSAFAPPDFDDRLMNGWAFVLPRTDGHRLPRDLDAVPASSCLCPRRTRIIRRYDQFQPRIHNGKTLRVTLDFQELCVHPAIVISVIFVLVCHPDPVVRVSATDEFDVCGLV